MAEIMGSVSLRPPGCAVDDRAVSRPVVIVAFHGVQSLDLVGPLDVLSAASNELTRTGSSRRAYTVRVVTPGGEPIRSTNGLRLVPDGPLETQRVDTLVVAGGDGVDEAVKDQDVIAAIAALAKRARRVASVCSGAFLLAEAGLLDGRRVTTHWARCAELAARYPAIDVNPDPIYIRDGDVWTSAGASAGMDLALALVEDDFGRDVALTVARGLVLFLKRPGSQAQFSAQLAGQLAERDEIRELQHWIVDHPDDDLRVEALAARAAMSPRHFARTFQQATGQTPARFVERVRLETARRRLAESKEAVESVALACGFGTPETMRQTFIRVLGTTPSEYRRQQGTSDPPKRLSQGATT
jgi:transcriptional regulator GlxA family with amidase domain